MVVDSCLNAAGDRAIALDYFDSLDVDVARQVRLVIVTHWHDDHIRGVGQLLQYADSARFACSVALCSDEFLTLVLADEKIKLVEFTSSVSEFAHVLEVLKNRRSGLYAVGPDHWAAHGMTIHAESRPYDVTVHALSPSAQSITDSKGQLARLIPRVGDAIRRFPSVAPNDLSVALLVQTRGPNLLLGADLESGGDEWHGWRAVVASKQMPPLLSEAYKVAHHGSRGADIEAIWSQLLSKEPIAVLTPFARGRTPLPTPADINRIKSRASKAYCTVFPPTTNPPRRRGVDGTMREVVRSRRATRRQPGHIRLRIPIDDDLRGISVELFDGATSL
jgi:hypothetical protein